MPVQLRFKANLENVIPAEAGIHNAYEQACHGFPHSRERRLS